MRSSVKRWLREPLLQFLVAGALLFAGYRTLHPEASRTTDDNRIEVTADDLRQLEIAWTAQWRRPPTPDEMRGLVDARVREEILYREALTLGLEQGDAIVKRRLAQKMEFLAGDVSTLPDPSAAELRAWYANNAERFAEPGRRSFRHVYFSTDRRGTQARVDATTALSQLSGKPADAPATNNVGDAFMFQNQYADRSPEQIASIFGSAVRCRGRSDSIRLLARTHRVGPGLASRLRTVRDSRARPLVRRNRAADQGGMAR